MVVISRAKCAGLIEASHWKLAHSIAVSISRAKCAGLIEASSFFSRFSSVGVISRAKCAGLIEAAGWQCWNSRRWLFPAQNARASLKHDIDGGGGQGGAGISRAKCAGLIEATAGMKGLAAWSTISRAKCAGLIEGIAYCPGGPPEPSRVRTDGSLVNAASRAHQTSCLQVRSPR